MDSQSARALYLDEVESMVVQRETLRDISSLIVQRHPVARRVDCGSPECAEALLRRSSGRGLCRLASRPATDTMTRTEPSAIPPFIRSPSTSQPSRTAMIGLTKV
jgi:hypothetical protein